MTRPVAKKVAIAVSAMMFALLPRGLVAQSSGAITGRVTDGRTGAPIPGIGLEILRWTWDNPKRLPPEETLVTWAITNADGRYSVDQLMPGSHKVGVVLADRTANTIDEIIVDFGPGNGLWQLENHNVTAWSRLHELSPVAFVAGQFH